MRVLAGLVWASAALQTYATSPEATVYFLDKDTEPSDARPPSVSPSTARLLLAQRLELSQYHSLEGADDSTVQYLNALGGTQKQIFLSGDQEETTQKLLVIVEGWENPKAILDPNSAGPAFTITQPPSPSQNLQLALDLLAQDRHKRSDRECRSSFNLPKESYIHGGTSGEDEGFEQCSLAGYMTGYREDDPTGNIQYLANCPSHGRTTILHISSLPEHLKDRQAYIRITADLKAAFMNLRLMPNPPETTIVLAPPHSSKSNQTDYGSYDMPSKSLHARQFQPEEPLSAPEPISTSTPPSRPSHPQTLATSVPHKGPLPVCHTSLETAEAATNNCSSHGTIYKKYSSPDAGEKEVDCYACKCNKTVITNDDGTTKTIYWGGPACQKKDVSVPFFLLAGFTIAMLATVSWAIGLLFSIGQEELPSVIGAGVAGPRAHK